MAKLSQFFQATEHLNVLKNIPTYIRLERTVRVVQIFCLKPVLIFLEKLAAFKLLAKSREQIQLLFEIVKNERVQSVFYAYLILGEALKQAELQVFR